MPVAKKLDTAISESTFADPNSVMGWERRKVAKRDQRQEDKNTLKQWYGMKRHKMTPDVEDELELLKYRHLLNKDTQRVAASKTAKPATEYFEFGFEVGTGKKKRKQFKSFADEYLREDESASQMVKHRIRSDTRHRRQVAKKGSYHSQGGKPAMRRGGTGGGGKPRAGGKKVERSSGKKTSVRR